MRRQFIRVLAPGRSDHFHQGRDRILVKVINPLRLVGDDQAALPPRIRGRNPGRAGIVVAMKGLHTAQRKHESARRIDPVGTKRQ